jgi:hypothetical protein
MTLVDAIKILLATINVTLALIIGFEMSKMSSREKGSLIFALIVFWANFIFLISSVDYGL